MASNEELAVSLARVEEQIKGARKDHAVMDQKLDRITDDHEFRIRNLETTTWRNRLALILLATLGGAGGSWVVKFFGLPMPPPGAG